MMVTLVLLLAGFFLMTFPLTFLLSNELGDLYWGILLPIFSFIIIVFFLLAIVTYLASWIYFVKLKGYRRWLGLLGLIPIIGPFILIVMKNKLPQEGEGVHVIITSLIGMIIPIVIIFSIFSIASSLKGEIENMAQKKYLSESKINATVKGVFHEKNKK